MRVAASVEMPAPWSRSTTTPPTAPRTLVPMWATIAACSAWAVAASTARASLPEDAACAAVNRSRSSVPGKQAYARQDSGRATSAATGRVHPEHQGPRTHAGEPEDRRVVCARMG